MSMARNLNQVYDGFQSITTGVDSGRPPMALDRNQLSWLVNGTTRGQFVQCRPGIFKHALTFANADGTVNEALQTAFTLAGRWQGASPYENGPLKALIASVGGRIYVVSLTDYSVNDITPDAGNNPNGTQTWWCQAEQYLVIQNNEDIPFIYDGVSLRRAVPQAQGGTELPCGNCMAYNNGRLWVALPDGRSFVAGDLAYAGKTGTAADLLSFTENMFLLGGGQFVLSANAGPIRAMCSIAAQDSVTGQGPLQVFTSRGSFSINAPFDRTQWQTTTSPIESVSMLAAGAVSQTATVNVNGDIWFRSPDGVRSFMIARREHGTWVNTPISTEMERLFAHDTEVLLTYASAVLFDNRWLVTAAPQLVTLGSITRPGAHHLRGVAHAGLGVLDFYPISGMAAAGGSITTNQRGQVTPNWDGLWTGLNTLQLLTIGSDTNQCFAFTMNATTTAIELWEVSRNQRFDNQTNPISWFLETPAYGFADGGWSQKRLAYGDLWFDRLAGDISFTMRYREDAYPFWNDWHTWSLCAPVRACEVDECMIPQTNEQYRSRQRLPEVSSTACDPVQDKPHRDGYRFQARLDISGFCRVRQLRLIAHNTPEEVVGSCP